MHLKHHFFIKMLKLGDKNNQQNLLWMREQRLDPNWGLHSNRERNAAVGPAHQLRRWRVFHAAQVQGGMVGCCI